MALPNYASKVERVAYAGYLAFCGVVLFFLIAPILTIIRYRLMQRLTLLLPRGC